ncbi:hypothetical protein ACFQJ5_13110 [Halomicroarcula sp. GCM10025324]|nr:hypothetical protein [Halomicroarcula sp. ZS-22-S1]
MTDAESKRVELAYGEFECAGERVVRLEDVERDEAWIRSTVFVPVEP